MSGSRERLSFNDMTSHDSLPPPSPNPVGLSHPLELPAAAMRAMVDGALSSIIDHIESLPTMPAANTGSGAELARSLREPLPETGVPFDRLLAEVFRVAETSFTASGPGYLAYIPGGGLFHSAVADLISDSINRYVGVWAAAPGLVQLETNVIRWFCEMVGYPKGSAGFLTSGGSLANFTAVVTARRDRLSQDFLSGTIYTSDQVHHSVLKAAMLAGFPEDMVRRVATDGEFRMRLDLLEQSVTADREAGLEPFMVIGSAGTTNTGAVDDLAAIADLARRYGLWFHADAAYGGFFALTERGRRILTGLDRADSLSLDPHKGLFLPYGTGSLLVRDGAALQRAHAVSADYMPDMQDDDDLVDLCNISPELSRPFRGLRAWLPLKMHGAGVFRDALDEKLDLARWITARLEDLRGIEIVARPQLSVLAFAVTGRGRSLEQANALTRGLMDYVNTRNRVHLTATTLNGRFVIRICVLSFRTHRDRMEQCLTDIVAGLDQVGITG